MPINSSLAQSLEQARQTALNIQRSLGELSTKGYGQTEISQIPQQTEISQLPTATGVPVLDNILISMENYLQETLRRGQTVNPYIEITPEKVAEFTAQAGREIDPYYQTQLKLAREGFLRSAGYTTEQFTQYEKNLEKQYGKQTRELGESMAEKGFALSSMRKREEQGLAETTQQDIESKRRQLGFETGTQARQFTQEWGQQNLPMTTTTQTPRVLPGGGFERTVSEVPFYEISPQTYEGLIGQKQYEQQAAKQTRVAGLESAWREQELAKRQRVLNV